MALKACLDTVCMPLFHFRHGTGHMLRFLKSVAIATRDPYLQRCFSLTPSPLPASVMVQRTDYCSKIPSQPARGLDCCCKYRTCTVPGLGSIVVFARGRDDQDHYDQYTRWLS